MYETRVLRRIFGMERVEVARGWRILHNEELHNSYSFSSIIIMFENDEVGRVCSMNWESRTIFIYLFVVSKKAGRKEITRTDVGRWIILRWM
jgi:hypothetical protein